MVYLLFFLSGAAGLIYEISWSRQLGLLFGHTVHAAAVVLAAYFAGMGLGYLLAGRIAHRLKLPLAGYGIAELTVAFWALATPFVLQLLELPGIASLLNHDIPSVQLAVRVIATFLVLLPATVALGATLPLIAQYVSPPSKPARARIALAYALNTAGAVVGVLLATFVMILVVGVRGSGLTAAGLSCACGIAAIWWAYRQARRSRLPAAPSITDSGQDKAISQTIAPLWYWLAVLSGAATLGLQVLYTRMFALTFHNSTYTFGGVVAVFLIALALGSWLVSRYGDRFSPRDAAAVACALGAVAIPISVAVFQNFTHLGYFSPEGGFLGYIAAALGLIAMVVLLPVAVLGVILPLCWQAHPVSDRGPGGVVGRLTAANTFAAMAGSLLASFVILPVLGLWPGFALFTALYALTAIVMLLKAYGWRRVALPVLVLVAFTGIASAAIQWPMSVTPRGAQLVYERETPYGLITVFTDSEADLWMRQNNHYSLGATQGGDSELRQGHIPLLLHPDPRRVCFLGLATGITASSSLMHPTVELATAVELIPEVTKAVNLFACVNGDFGNVSRSEIVVNDARHYLYATSERFDVIISDLFVPWHSQTGYLYTVEHYRAARNHLAPGGLFCQWLPLYQVGSNELELIADSFASVFPNTTVWRGEFSHASPLIALIGSDQPLEIDGSQLQARVAALPDPFTGRDPVLQRGINLLELYVGDWRPRRPGYLNTDEHPRVEFLAPVSHRRRLKLTRQRLLDYYHDVFNTLPVTSVLYTPRAAEPHPDMTAGRKRQVAGGEQ